MKLKRLLTLTILLLPLAAPHLMAQEKVTLEEPKAPDLLADLKEAPDGVLRVKNNPDGSFKSMVVKASVEIEDVLGAQKGKQLARNEAEVQCKKHLSQWLSENFVFAEASNKTVTIQTKGESAKDAAGNTVKVRSQQGQEFKVLTESHASLSQAALKGLIVVSSDVLKSGEEFVLVMALTQKSLNQSGTVADALAGRTPSPLGSTGDAGTADRPAAESLVNRDALDDLR